MFIPGTRSRIAEAAGRVRRREVVKYRRGVKNRRKSVRARRMIKNKDYDLLGKIVRVSRDVLRKRLRKSTLVATRRGVFSVSCRHIVLVVPPLVSIL